MLKTRPRETGPDRETREIVLGRADRKCERCGTPMNGPAGYSLQHRIARGMGGTRDPKVNTPSHLVLLCGSATTHCHGDVERRRPNTHGWWLNRHELPSSEPVTLYDGRRVILTDEGTYVELGDDAERLTESDNDA